PLPDRLSWRTGHLTRSISTDSAPNLKTWIVGSTVNYAPVHELGLRVGNARYPARPFLTPAAEWVIENRAPDFFERALRDLRARS
ncbi:MAG: phage virion morphogenesis protein, partial [Planctomycetia bacterium]